MPQCCDYKEGILRSTVASHDFFSLSHGLRRLLYLRIQSELLFQALSREYVDVGPI